MAEHNTQDTKSSVPPRRGARPFVGPAGGAGQPLPLLRVTTTPRPAGAPFVPAPATRAPLGAATRVATQAAPAAKAPSVIEPDVGTASLVSPDATEPLQAPVESVPGSRGVLASGSADTAAVESPEPTQPGGAEHPSGSPFAEALAGEAPESLGDDRFASFDAAWPDAMAEVALTAGTPAPPLDLASLGSPDDVHLPWTEELTAGTDATAVESAAGEPMGPDFGGAEPTVANAAAAEPSSAPDLDGPAWLMDDGAPEYTVDVADGADAYREDASAHDGLQVEAIGTASSLDQPDPPEAVSGDVSWSDVTFIPSADAVMAAGITEPSDIANDEPIESAYPAMSTTDWPDPLLAEYAPYVPTPAPSTASRSRDSGVEDSPDPPTISAARVETPADDAAGVVERVESPATDAIPSVAAEDTHSSRVAGTLDRLAAQVRHGEIDVSSVAPEGPDAAVLAAVLAALLGGGRSGSR